MIPPFSDELPKVSELLGGVQQYLGQLSTFFSLQQDIVLRFSLLRPVLPPDQVNTQLLAFF